MKQAVEMTVYGKPGKRWCCFPTFPQTLEIDQADSHIPTATTTTGFNIPKTRPLRATHSEGKVNAVPGFVLDYGRVPLILERLNQLTHLNA
jgi:hypothetical protein